MGRGNAGGMSVRLGRALWGISLALFGTPLVARAQTPDADSRRWAVGLEATWLGVPRGHVGLMPSLAGSGISAELMGRYRFSSFAAVDVGFGLPHSAMGLSGWGAIEVFGTAVANQQRSLVLELFQQVGFQVGRVGPDYFARHEDSFVGYGYVAAGPLGCALRLPAGINLRWAYGRLDSYAEVVPIVTLTPSREVLYTLATGIRYRF